MKKKVIILFFLIVASGSQLCFAQYWGIQAGAGLPTGKFSSPPNGDVTGDLGAKIGYSLGIARVSAHRHFDLLLQFEFNSFGDKYIRSTSDGYTTLSFNHDFFILTAGIEKTLLTVNEYQPFAAVRADFVVHKTRVNLEGYKFDHDPNDDFDMIIVPGLSLAFGNYYAFSDRLKLKIQGEWMIAFSGNQSGGVIGNLDKKLSYPYNYDAKTISFVLINLGFFYQF